MSLDLKKILLRNTLTNYIYLFWNMITAVFITRIIFLGLGDELFGYWALLWGIFGYAILLDFGFGKSVQKYTAEVTITKDFKKYNKIISSIICTYGLISLVIIMVSVLCSYFLEYIFSVENLTNLNYCKQVLIVFGVGTALVFPTGFIPEILMGINRSDIKNYICIVTHTFKIVGIYLFFEIGYSIMTLVVITVIMNLIPNIFMLISVRKLLPEFKLSFKHFQIYKVKESGSFSLYAYIYAIAVMILFKTDVLVLGIMLGMNAVAIYQIGTRVSYLLESLTTQFQNTLPAIAASLYKSKDFEKLRWVLLKSSRLTVFISTGTFILFILLTKQILYLWLEIKDSDAVLISYLMLCSVYVMVLFRSTSVKFMQMAGKHKEIAYIYLSECIINIVLSVILVHLIGVIGVVLGTLIPNVIFSLFVIFRMFAKFSNFSLKYYLNKVYLPIIIVVLPTTLLLICANLLKGPYSWNYLDLLTWSLGAGILYLGMGYLVYFSKEEKKKYMGMIPIVNKFYK